MVNTLYGENINVLTDYKDEFDSKLTRQQLTKVVKAKLTNRSKIKCLLNK